MENLISKKELLQLMNISYGQLYRWKRENLIPESWFIKKSTFTGHETYFIKDKIIKRINSILKLKEQFSLDDLSKIISPEFSKMAYPIEDIRKITELEKEVLDLFIKNLKKDYFNLMELVFVLLLSKISKDMKYDLVQLEKLYGDINNWFSEIEDTLFHYMICRLGDQIFSLIIKPENKIIFDDQVKVLKIYDLNELLEFLKIEINEIINT